MEGMDRRSALALGAAAMPVFALPAQAVGTEPPSTRPLDDAFRRRAFEVRVGCARSAAEVPAAPHPTNGDEERYPNKIGSDTRGLPHDQRGEVDLAAWGVALDAYRSGDARHEEWPADRHAVVGPRCDAFLPGGLLGLPEAACRDETALALDGLP